MRRTRTTNSQDVENSALLTRPTLVHRDAPWLRLRSRIAQGLNVLRVRLGLVLRCGLAGQQL